MMWYLAKVVSKTKNQSRKGSLVEIQDWIISAESSEDAFQKTMELAREVRYDSVNVKGEKISFRIIGLNDLQMIGSVLTSGTRIADDHFPQLEDEPDALDFLEAARRGEESDAMDDAVRSYWGSTISRWVMDGLDAHVKANLKNIEGLNRIGQRHEVHDVVDFDDLYSYYTSWYLAPVLVNRPGAGFYVEYYLFSSETDDMDEWQMEADVFAMSLPSVKQWVLGALPVVEVLDLDHGEEIMYEVCGILSDKEARQLVKPKQQLSVFNRF